MKNKTWHDNKLHGKDVTFIMNEWHNKMPKRWINYQKAQNAR